MTTEQPRLADSLTDEEKQQIAKQQEQPLHVTYWENRQHINTEIKKALTDTDELPNNLDALLDELNELAPKWLAHHYDPKTKQIAHSINYEQFLKAIQLNVPLIFTSKYKNGILYTGKHWEEYESKREAKEFIKTACIDEIETVKLYSKLSNPTLSKIYSYVQAGMTKEQHIDFDTNNYANFANGTLDLNTNVLHPHTKEDHITKLLPIEYVDSDEGGLVYDYAKHLLGDEVQTLSEWFGYMFFNDMATMNNIVFIQGVGGNGKSTLLHTLSQAFGQYAGGYSISQLDGRDGDRFLDELSRKQVNIIAESDPYITDNGLNLIKKLTGGDPIGANPKGKKPYTFINTAKFIVSANYNLPAIENEPEFRRRFVLLNAGAPAISSMADPKAFKDKYNREKMLKELPLFVSYSIKQAQKAMANKELTILPETKARTEQWLLSTDYVQHFTDMFIVPITGMYGVSRPYLLEHFNEFLGVEADDRMTAQEFTQAMGKKGFEFEITPRYGKAEDSELIDDFTKSKRNRLKGYGYKE
ncbi:DNA primase family protein [Weissella viridescens]|uniref:DNA primase family protein n=1 Tax=Weissella viridescens TaxID=1629 RepID=UPI003AF232A6